MEDLDKALTVAGDYLIRFYHEEPDDLVAASRALRESIGHYVYAWNYACAFKLLLASTLPAGTLTELVCERANRYARDDNEAREFLERVYKDSDMYAVLDPALIS